jgi:hypothetical protein
MRRKENETEFALYRYGSTDIAGLSGRICARQPTTTVFETKRNRPPGEFTGYCSSRAEVMIKQKIMYTRKKGYDAYSND